MALKAVKHKPCGNQQLLPVFTDCWKNLSIDFITELPISTIWNDNNYDSILVIIDGLTKIVHYETVMITINVLELGEVILNMAMQYYGLINSIVVDWDLVFILKLWLSLCYFLEIKQKLSTAFHS